MDGDSGPRLTCCPCMVPTSHIPRIVSQHAEEASFLWILRDVAVHAPHYTLKDLAHLDSRIEAHLEGLLVAGEEGWRICVDELKWEEPGEVFAAAALAFLSNDIARMQPVLDVTRKSLGLARGMISALGFLPHEQVMGRIEQLSGSQSPELRFIGLSASAIQRIDPGRALTQSVESKLPYLRARAFRAIGELSRRDLLPALRAGLNDLEDEPKFWAAWSLGLLGDRGAADALKSFATPVFPRATMAADMAARLQGPQPSSVWRESLAGDPATIRLAFTVAAATGDPSTIPWLISMMDDKKLSRAAGEALTTITGADLALLDLETEGPEEPGSEPNDNPADENVAMDPDENLPWPDRALVEQWWSKNASRFAAGRRYLLGEVVSEQTLQNVLRIGHQRHRAAAAIELALSNPKSTAPLFEVRGSARAQQRLLGIRA